MNKMSQACQLSFVCVLQEMESLRCEQTTLQQQQNALTQVASVWQCVRDSAGGTDKLKSVMSVHRYTE